MLALTEGLEPFANKSAFIYRREASGSKNEIAVALDKILQRKSPDVPLVANDILYIPDNRGKRIGVKALEAVIAAATGAGAYGLASGRF
jgi:polysaccharide export outer membrane protein